MTKLIKKVKDEFAMGVLFLSIVVLYLADGYIGPFIGHGLEALPIVLIGGMLLFATLATELSEGTIFPPFLVALFIDFRFICVVFTGCKKTI